MATLLYVYCPNCAHIQCAAVQLTQETLKSMKKENEAIFKGIMVMEKLYVFCRQRKRLRVINIIG